MPKNHLLFLLVLILIIFFVIPTSKFNVIIEFLNYTKTKTGNMYWHICISENLKHEYAIMTQKWNDNFDLNPFINRL